MHFWVSLWIHSPCHRASSSCSRTEYVAFDPYALHASAFFRLQWSPEVSCGRAGITPLPKHYPALCLAVPFCTHPVPVHRFSLNQKTYVYHDTLWFSLWTLLSPQPNSGFSLVVHALLLPSFAGSRVSLYFKTVIRYGVYNARLRSPQTLENRLL